MLLIAESSHEVSAFAAQAAAVPGSAEEREGLLAGISHTEVYPLTLFAVGGMLLFPASNDLLTMFVALEVLSLPLYLLCGLARRRRLLSQEAAMKYFLLGAFSSAFFLFGVAMLPMQSVPHAIEEMRFAKKELGFKGCFLRPNPYNDKMISDPMYEPFWAAAAALDLPLAPLPLDLAEPVAAEADA